MVSAAGDPAELADCQRSAAACASSTQGTENTARDRLSHDTHRCWKECQDDAGADDGGAGEDMDGCLADHTPKLPMCVRGLVGCLKEAGVRRHGAAFGEIRACVHEAHVCFIDRLRERWHDRHDNPAADAAVDSAVDAAVDAGDAGETGGTGGVGGMGGAAGQAGPERDPRGGGNADAGPDDDSDRPWWWPRGRRRD